MKISTKCRYGIRALVEIAKNPSSDPMTRNTIAKKQEIPDSYLENILIALKHGNIVTSIRGAGGGFVLSRPPEEINLLDVYEVLQGSISLLDCVDCPEVCDRSKDCVVRPVWLEMQEAQKEVLKNKSIKDLIELERIAEEAKSN